MKAIMVMFDSLNRHMLSPYGCDWTHAPNFARLAKRAVTFDRSYVCSMPCMPARRDLMTARPSFLHRGWSPLEPFDDAVPEILQQHGVYTHLASDHYHYWEDGGATYHNRYNSSEFFRGQEGDPCVGQVAEPDIPPNLNGKARCSDWVNRQFLKHESDYPQPKTFAAGLQFIERNATEDNWFLQIECFDPHEPFNAPRKYQDLYPHDYTGALFDWPAYREVTETPEEVQHVRYQYASLLSMCDAHLGDVLDAMDKYHLWRDTMLIVWTDHGFLLGEHNCWAKNWMPLYEEVAHTPFFVWDPRGGAANERRQALVQPAIDLGPTLLDFFGAQSTSSMLGHNLRPVLESDTAVREAAIFGYHGHRLNVTDGRYVYLRDWTTQGNGPLYEYTLMPTRMRGFVATEQLQHAGLAEPFAFTKGCRTLKIGLNVEAEKCMPRDDATHLLFDLQSDPQQHMPLQNAEIEQMMLAHAVRLMRECDAPPEQWQRLGLPEK
jgi:arylsulfatase A-like enzyme